MEIVTTKKRRVDPTLLHKIVYRKSNGKTRGVDPKKSVYLPPILFFYEYG
jgi:hypothetical protein